MHVQMQAETGGLWDLGKNGLLTSGFGSSTWGERHNSYYVNHPQHAAHLVMFKISVGRDLQNSNYMPQR